MTAGTEFVVLRMGAVRQHERWMSAAIAASERVWLYITGDKSQALRDLLYGSQAGVMGDVRYVAMRLQVHTSTK